MALPTLTKTYQISPNNIVATQSEDTFYPELMYMLKVELTGFASNPWTVVASSDATTASAADHWASKSNVVWGTGAHSWIVLQRADGAQMLWSCDFTPTTNPEDAIIHFSPGGNFTGFTSTSVDPTASDEMNIMTGIALGWWGDMTGEPVSFRTIAHIWHSTDGLVTRMVGCYNDAQRVFVNIETLDGAATAHTDKIAAGWYSNVANVMTTEIGEDTGHANTYHSGTSYRMRHSGEGMSAFNLMEFAAIGGVVDDISGVIPTTRVGYVAHGVGARGIRGAPYDLWWGPSLLASNGDTFPNNASLRDFVLFGDYLLPWTGDATVPVTI